MCSLSQYVVHYYLPNALHVALGSFHVLLLLVLVLVLLLSHVNSCQKSRVRGHTKVLES